MLVILGPGALGNSEQHQLLDVCIAASCGNTGHSKVEDHEFWKTLFCF